MGDESFVLDMADDAAVDQSMDFGDDMGDMSDEKFSVGGDDRGLGGNDDIMVDGEAGMNVGEADNRNLEGFDDLFEGDDVPPRDTDFLDGSSATHARPAFFGASNKAAERSALRTKYNDGDALIIEEGRDMLISAPSRVPGTFGRRNREKGSTLPAYHKKVSHELDSDDELMIDMREKGYSDRQVTDKLARDGCIRYGAKSIATRISRIRVAQAEHVDWLLKEGYKEWRLEDDQLLMRAYDLADIEIRYEIERICAWRFKKVSEYMRRLDKSAMFGANACRERYTAMIDGTAVIPTDQDDDPDARRLEMEMFRQKREVERAVEQAEKDKKEAQQQRIKDEARSRQAKKAAETAVRRDKMRQEKANRAVKRAAQASIRAQKSSAHKKKKAERHAAIRAEKDAEEAEKLRKKVRTEALNPKNFMADSPDPRADLSFDDLQMLCADRDLSKKGGKTEILRRLIAADEALKTTELKALLRSKGISLGGNNTQMRLQLALANAMGCPSYQGPGAINEAAEEGDDEELSDYGFESD
ncbi:hypothetical protein K458DRAFT_429165 [Lentithecium fluviatile CBS 122367]|uniref:SAP domain-containing protein n=1 Tax=Lentithecium fluviatile CBS 122367 TaxID=1168545 RepID=A0A6G1JAQ1_9PLEO|nr:hypothetical protein K458DRAFT_429165 [Lentithecium fluviatile CBS 122367]